MNRYWLKSYPPGVPAEIDPARLTSLADLLRQACSTYRDRPAFEQMGRTMTFARLDELTRDFAAWLQSAGMAKGDRIAIMLPNTLQYPIALFGALRAGLIVVNTNPLYTARELQHQLEDSGAAAIVVLENFAHVVQEVAAHTRLKKVLVTAAGDYLGFPKSSIVNYVVRHRRKQVPHWHIPGAMDFRDAVRAGRKLPFTPVDVGPEDIAFLQYTGGTTGVAKGAMLTHGNVSCNVLQAEAWVAGTFPREGGVVITAIPLYHVFALTANCLLCTHLGWKNVLIINPRDCPAMLKELRKQPFAFFTGVNTLFNAMLNAPGFAAIDFSHLVVTLGGGMAVQESVAKRWKEVTGNILTQAWGLTETSPAAAINPTGEEFNGSVGLPIPSSEITIKNDEGHDLPVGQTGEICVRGPHVMRGYWNRPDETAKVMLPDGWLRTGDVGYMDERGYVFIQDRKKDMILVSGFNVYPNEVEAVAATHPGILECAAVAQPDEHSGEVVALYVVLKDPKVTEHDIIEHCRKSLAGYKVPRHVYFRKELPKSNVGKILRKELRG
ncbi:MAG TPA: AMP-binding protein, partial [Steroidobacteraceae bacterium]|nr:AMP-binding protein [Steroidobacteraceae bacterium]